MNAVSCGLGIKVPDFEAAFLAVFNVPGHIFVDKYGRRFVNEKAIEHFNKAIEIAPDHINHHLELGITFEGIKDWESAKAEYDKVLELPVSDSDDPDHKKEAEERLNKVEGKIN